MHSFDLNYNSFVYPWQNSTVSERLKVLGQKNKTKILYIYDNPDNSTFRYRAYNMCEILDKSEKFAATYIFASELDFLLKHLEMVDFIVLVRVKWSVQMDRIFSKAAANNIKIYFDVDDLVYDVTKIPLLMSSLQVGSDTDSHNYWFSYVSRIFLAAKNSDFFITTNNYLAKKIADFFNKQCAVIPNFINYAQMILSDQIFDLKRNTSDDKEDILIGYFSGSPSHNNDFASISVDLCSLMERNKKIKLRLVGFLSIPDILRKFVDIGRIEVIPLQNYLDLQVKIAECDINLIPLLINEFTHCKSEIKYFEAAIVATQSIATPTYIYNKVIQDGKNGYLATPGEWYEKIEKIINGRGRFDVIQAAKKHCVENYYGQKILENIEHVFTA